MFLVERFGRFLRSMGETRACVSHESETVSLGGTWELSI